jgi:hypothetical protein
VRRTVQLPARGAQPERRWWLRHALIALAAEAPAEAERLFTALLPGQMGAVRRPVVYDVVVHGGSALRVTVDRDRVSVVPRPSGAIPADARFEGPLSALVALVAGGAFRLPGVRVEGRGRVRRLLWSRRGPVALAKLAATDVSPEPRDLLALLVQGVDPAWTMERPAVVDIDAIGAECLRVVVPAGGRPTIGAARHGADADATLRVPAAALLAVLADTAPTGTGLVEGDLEAALYLLTLLDRARHAV